MFHILLYCILYTWILLADNRWPVGAGFTCNICTLPQPEQENDQHPSVGLWCASFRYRTPVQAGWQPVAPPMSRHFHRVRSVTHTRKFTAHTHTVWTRYRHDVRINPTRTHIHGDTRGRRKAHTTPPQRRRCVYLLTCRGGVGGGYRGCSRARGRAGVRAAGRPVGITSPVAGNRFGRAARRSKGAFAPGSVHSWTLLYARVRCTRPRSPGTIFVLAPPPHSL